MGLTTILKKIFGGADSAANSAKNVTDTSSYLTNDPEKKLKVRTIDATRDAANLANNTLKKSADKATKTASKAKEAGNKIVDSSEKLYKGIKEKANHAFE
jgi:hypothetical protein